MTAHVIGQLCALLTAILWAFALILFKKSGERVPPMGLNLFKNSVALILLIITVAFIPEDYDTLQTTSWRDIGILLISGILGLAVADTLIFYALNLAGVGLMAIVECTYSPFVIAFSFLLLGEELTGWHYAGAALILVGVYVSSKHDPPADRTREQVFLGIVLGVLAIGLIAFAIVIAKPALTRVSVMWGSLIRLFAGTISLALLVVFMPNRGRQFAIFKPSADWKIAMPGAVIGTYVCLILWTAGFKYTYAAIAGVLNQTSTVFAIVFATLLLGEPFSRRKAASVLVALFGVGVIAFGNNVQAWLSW